MTGARDTLRRETRDMHDRVDAVYSAFRLDTQDGYAAFLAAQARAHIPCEVALDEAGAALVVPDWAARRRGRLLIDDLADIGSSADARDAVVSGAVLAFSGAAAVLGAVYVLEGSRLGGAMLVRSVPQSLPRRFLGASVPGAWRNLMHLIDRRLGSDREIADAVVAARQVFELFENAGRASIRVA